MEYFIHALKNYAVFSGRARRKEYWMFALFQFIFSIGALFLDNMLDPSPNSAGVISGIYSLAILLPSLAVGVRRLHDIGKSGWFMLILFVPLIGAIWLLVLFCTAGDLGPNEYGQDPKDMAVLESPTTY
jgi:uncharacterized membrane protein YhaH (DUF805 family)